VSFVFLVCGGNRWPHVKLRIAKGLAPRCPVSRARNDYKPFRVVGRAGVCHYDKPCYSPMARIKAFIILPKARLCSSFFRVLLIKYLYVVGNFYEFTIRLTQKKVSLKRFEIIYCCSFEGILKVSGTNGTETTLNGLFTIS
jgi:hypothetical protein